MSKKVKRQYFSKDDLHLLETALFVFPNLALVTFGAKLIRQNLEYPLSKHEDLRSLFGQNGRITIMSSSFSFKEFKRFMPKEFFPIESEEQFFKRALIALQIGENSHYYDRNHIDQGQAYKQITILPSPAPRPIRFGR